MSPRAIILAILAILLVSVGGGVVAHRYARTHDSPHEKAADLARAGKLQGAEEMYWSMLQEGPVTVPLLLGFLDAHARAVSAAEHVGLELDDDTGHPSPLRFEGPKVEEAAIDAFLARPDLPSGVVLLGRYWRGYRGEGVDPEVEKAVRAAADRDPPEAWANHVLAQVAHREARYDVEAERLLREATYFPERSGDLDTALEVWADADDWDRIDHALADPRVSARAQPWFRLRSALRVHDWKTAARVFPRCLRSPLTVGSVLLATLAALAWGVFCARLGGVSSRPKFRIPLYLVAFALGVASVSLTVALIAVEETFLKMTETGNPLRDFLYFTFGVGLREEFSKLAFFALLLPVLHRHGTRLDVLVCGALVGLGFASEENLGYLANGDLSTAMGRFLTANFLHISMTAQLAGALDQMVRHGKRGEDGSLHFSLTLLKVAGLHGLYDFCISSHVEGGGLAYFAMGIFFILARQFLSAVSWSRAAERAKPPYLLETFALGMAVLVGGSFVYASAMVGPGAAAAALASGLLGLGIIIVLFVQELRAV
ncbi:MAG TPA: PrsW family glutamic-type intramembrane protease [Polyangiaceae bacterium]